MTTNSGFALLIALVVLWLGIMFSLPERPTRLHMAIERALCLEAQGYK